MILHAYLDVDVLCVCIVGHGCDYTTDFTFLERFWKFFIYIMWLYNILKGDELMNLTLIQKT